MQDNSKSKRFNVLISCNQIKFEQYFIRRAAACLLLMASICENSFAINTQNPFQGTNTFLVHYACMIQYNVWQAD